MALRWRRTIDVAPHMFPMRAEAEHDWLLYCGGWQVGRVHRPGGRPSLAQVYAWSLTGPYAPPAVPLTDRGEADTVEAAKEQLIEAMRSWAMWAGLRQSDGGGPVPPRWVRAAEHTPHRPVTITRDPDTHWLMLSGAFIAGRIYRPPRPLRNRLVWQLLATGPMQGPGPNMGAAETVEVGKDRVRDAWQAWLCWAELLVS
jgi:hypothetical protein